MNTKELIQNIVSYIISILGMLILSPLIIFIIIIDMYRGGDEMKKILTVLLMIVLAPIFF